MTGREAAAAFVAALTTHRIGDSTFTGVGIDTMSGWDIGDWIKHKMRDELDDKAAWLVGDNRITAEDREWIIAELLKHAETYLRETLAYRLYWE